MLDLCAITGRAAEFPVGSNQRKYYIEFWRRDVFMQVNSDQPVNAFFFDGPDCTLICRADLLEPDSCINIAAYLAGLYRIEGDRFVSGLHGTFAIILYDHTQRTLKAWTDHFGAERLVFCECDGSLAVGTNIHSTLAIHQEQPTISPAAIQEYLLYTCIPTPKTIYQGISKVPPGHQLVSRPTVRTQCYWDMTYRE